MGDDIVTIATRDGLNLEAARYAGGTKTPALCLPGLTRNRRDFSDFAKWFAGTGRDVYALSLRGRGGSDYDTDHLNYHSITYRDDVIGALDQLGVVQAIFVGTSLGGIVTMLTNEAAPDRVAAAVINDIGPELAVEGLTRIAGFVGAERADAVSLEEAAAQIRAINEIAFPGRDEGFWRDFARNTFRQAQDGKWVLDYDPALGKALIETAPGPDLWPAFISLVDTPTLLVRGALSDLLSQEIVDKMRAVHPDFDYGEVPRVGHAPTLTEPAAQAAIEAFLAKLD